MSFIDKDSDLVINCRLTTIGRQLIASGGLTFGSWVVGDSEIDYTYASNEGMDPSNFVIQTPKDLNPPLKYPILPSTTSLSPYNPIGTIYPIQVLVRNTANTRGFFSGSTGNFVINSNSNYSIQNNLEIALSGVTGGTTVKISQDAGFVFNSEPLIGDYLFVNWINPAYAGSAYTTDVIYTNNPTPQLWYEIQNISGTIAGNNLVVTVDRALPNFGSSSNIAKAIIFPGGDAINNFYSSGTTTPYWNGDTLNFNSTCNIGNDDVLVWNMNIVYTEDFAGKLNGYEGIGQYGSSGYTGFKNYISDTFDKPTQKALGIIHYSNNSINNYYGEQLYQNTLVLDLPTVIWYNNTGNTMGLTLTCDSTAYTSVPGSGATDLNTTYYNLIDSQGLVVGRNFVNLKTIVIEDEELIAAMSYKSNRNWSYPGLVNAGNTNGIPVTRPNIFTSANQMLYMTYFFENTSGYTASNSYGYADALHCQYYQTYTPTLNPDGSLNNAQVPTFTLDSANLQFVTKSTGFNNGIGVTFNKFKILYQMVSSVNQRPDPTQWLEYDYTSKLSGYPFTNGIIDVTTFNTTIYTFDNNMFGAGVSYNLNNYITLPLSSQSNVLNFGDEVYFFGNVSTDIGATVYKTNFVFTLPYNQFNVSSNPTYSNSGLNTYISEVAIYDNNLNMVAIGKLNYPMQKSPNQVRVIQLSIDF